MRERSGSHGSRRYAVGWMLKRSLGGLSALHEELKPLARLDAGHLPARAHGCRLSACLYSRLVKESPPAQGWLPELFPSLCDGISLPELCTPVRSRSALCGVRGYPRQVRLDSHVLCSPCPYKCDACQDHAGALPRRSGGEYVRPFAPRYLLKSCSLTDCTW